MLKSFSVATKTQGQFECSYASYIKSGKRSRNRNVIFRKMGLSRSLFSLFLSLQQLTVKLYFLLMTEVESWTSGIEYDHAAN